MKTILFLTTLLLSSMASQAQSLRKYPLGNSGCSVYCFCEPKVIMDRTIDSAAIYQTQCQKDEIYYSVRCVKLAVPITDIDSAENMTIGYMDYLKGSYSVTKAAGYGKGHRLNNNENTRGVIDYWEDENGSHFKAKGWTDGKFIAIMIAHSKKELPETKVNVFLDGFRLPQ